MKSILKEWKNFQINEMSRLYGEDPTNFPEEALSDAARIQKKDRTNLELKDYVLELYELVKNNDNLLITFSDVDFLGVSPEVRYDTPHGIYGYPFKMDNLFSYLKTGLPTAADFASYRPYIHIYKIKGAGNIEINKDNSTNYDDRNYSKDLKSMTQMFLNYVTSALKSAKQVNPIDHKKSVMIFKKYDSVDQVFNSFFSDGINFNENNDLAWYSPLFADFILSLFENDFFGEIRIRKDDEEEVDEIPALENTEIVNPNQFNNIVRYFMMLANNLAEGPTNKFYSRIRNSKFYKLYFAAYFYSTIIQALSRQNTTISIKQGAMYTMLLTSAGISAINDSKGTSTLHPSEPSQGVVFDISENDRYELLGTYNNINANGLKSDELMSIVSKEIEKGNIDIRDIPDVSNQKSSDLNGDIEISDHSAEDKAFFEASEQLDEFFELNQNKIAAQAEKYSEEIFNLYTPNDIDHFSEEAANILRDDFFAENAQLFNEYIYKQFKNKLSDKNFNDIENAIYTELSNNVAYVLSLAYERLRLKMLEDKNIPSHKANDLLNDIDYWKLRYGFTAIVKYCIEDMLITNFAGTQLLKKYSVPSEWEMEIDS